LRGEPARGKDKMQGYRTTTLRRRIGKYATSQETEETE